MKGSEKFNKCCERLIDSIYPWRCQICGSATKNKGICNECEPLLPWCEVFARCEICALPLAKSTNEVLICGSCQRQPPFYDDLTAVFWYEPPVDELITRYKYSNQWQNIQTLTELTKASFIHCNVNKLVIPVPSHVSRIRQRGFNVVYELIKQYKRHVAFEHNNSLVIREKKTDSQTGKSKSQRRQNVRKAFSVVQPKKFDHVVIFDEVVTTGATINELSRCLKNSGVDKVSVWALARTRSRHYIGSQ